MIFSEKGRGAPFLRKNHPLNQQCPFWKDFQWSELLRDMPFDIAAHL
jgi:hypothetical protein